MSEALHDAPGSVADARPAEGGKVTTDDVRRALRAKYGPNGAEWAFFEEVRDASGFGASRSADGVAVHLWPSKGHAVHGFEIKVTRADWLRELEQPGKYLGVGQYCDHWWIVAPKKVVRPGELPAEWGLLVYDGVKSVSREDDRLRTEVKAPKRTHVEAIDRSFLACLLRRAAQSSATPADLAAARAAERESAKRDFAFETRHTREQLERLEKAVREFEAAAGVKFSPYDGPRLAEAVELLRLGGEAHIRNRLDTLRLLAAQIVEQVDTARARVAA